jgi:hypothetical protein
MKKLLIAPRDRTPIAFAFLLALGLTTALWVATIPVASARLMTPKEMIEAGLPPGIVMKTASKPQFLTAVCAAVKEHRKAAPAIAETAVTAHHEYAGDIVATVVRCANGNCELAGAIVAAAISATPDDAVAIEDDAVAAAPDCADAIQAATANVGHAGGSAQGPSNYSGSPPTNQPSFVGPVGGGGGFDPALGTVLVCDNGTARFVPANQLSNFLASHPGSFVGACVVTPSTSR